MLKSEHLSVLSTNEITYRYKTNLDSGDLDLIGKWRSDRISMSSIISIKVGRRFRI